MKQRRGGFHKGGKMGKLEKRKQKKGEKKKIQRPREKHIRNVF